MVYPAHHGGHPQQDRRLAGEVCGSASRLSSNIVLHLATENMLDNLFEKRLANDDLLPIEKDGKRYLLVETFYFNPPMDLHDILKRIQQKGYYPLLAHPERYEYMTMKDYKALKEANVFFQLNLPALGGFYGKGVQKKTEVLLKNDMYDFIGNDVHSIRNFHYMIKLTL